jgi:uncharacterized protein (DUF58 family)
MTFRAALGILLVLAGAWLDVQIALALGVVTVGFELVRRPWLTRGTAGIGYRRALSSGRIPWGETVTLTVETWNLTRLPVSWLRTDDAISAELVVREQRLRAGELGELTLRNTWTLGPRELVRRRLHVGANRRGVFHIGPMEMVAGDLFALPAAHASRPQTDRIIAWPRTLPAPAIARRERWGGTDRARSGLTEDPARFVGVREYRPGDPVRRLHARTSARLGRPMSKRFEPSRDRDVLLVLDLEPGDGPADGGHEPDGPAEDLIAIAASLVRSLAMAHAAFGLAAAGYAGSIRRIAFLPVSPGAGQLERALDMLARLSSEPTMSFERLAAFIARTAREGTTVLVLTGREAGPLLRPLQSLRRHGVAVGVLASGEGGAAAVAQARAAGLSAQALDLDGEWRTASRVGVVG